MPTMDAQNIAAGRPFALTKALTALTGGLGTDVSLQLDSQLQEERKKMKQGRPSDPSAYGDRMISPGVLGIFGGAR